MLLTSARVSSLASWVSSIVFVSIGCLVNSDPFADSRLSTYSKLSIETVKLEFNTDFRNGILEKIYYKLLIFSIECSTEFIRHVLYVVVFILEFTSLFIFFN